MSDTVAVMEIGSEAFAKRLANLMVATRSKDGRSVRQLARASEGRFSKRDLKALEEGTIPLDDDLVEVVAELYGCDLGVILPTRLPVTIAGGIISAGGVSAAFEPNNSTALLEAYLKLVRSMRRQHQAPAVDLRRDDIEVLAGFLHQPGETIVERLAALMGASRSQRAAMAGLFASGAMVIGLVGTAMAGGGGVTTRGALVKGPTFDSIGRGATAAQVVDAPHGNGAGHGREVGGTGWTHGGSGRPATEAAQAPAAAHDDGDAHDDAPQAASLDASARDAVDMSRPTNPPKIDEDRPDPVVSTDVGAPGTGGTTDPRTDSPDPGTGPTDPGTGPTDPGTGPTDPGAGPTDPGAGPTDPGAGPTDPGTG
ncbi:MAG: hypothetical protein ACOYMR_10775, partial [Ilumatobacteraceae bacterium]